MFGPVHSSYNKVPQIAPSIKNSLFGRYIVINPIKMYLGTFFLILGFFWRYFPPPSHVLQTRWTTNQLSNDP